MTAPLFIGVDETAKVLNLGRESVYARLREGTIPSIRIGKKFRVRVRDLADLTGLTTKEITEALAVQA